MARKALDTLGIARLAPRHYTEISGGERQIVRSRARWRRSRALIADRNLDFGNRCALPDRIRGLAASGIAIVRPTIPASHAFACARRAATAGDFETG